VLLAKLAPEVAAAIPAMYPSFPLSQAILATEPLQE